MAIPFPTVAYLPCYEVFARPVTFYPLNSQPGVASYGGRGIFDTNSIEIVAQDGSLYSDTRTELDILQSEFDVLPMQGDRLFIPWDQELDGGSFEVSDVSDKGNAGGESTLTLRRLVVDKLVGTAYTLGALDFARPVLNIVKAPLTATSYSLASPEADQPVLTVTP
jgi:hypothetical protein